MSSSHASDGPPAVRTAVVLAGERPGGNALAQAFQSESSLTLDLNGQPIIDWTLRALSASVLERLVLVGPGAAAQAHPCVEDWLAKDNVQWVEPAAGPAASAVRGAQHIKHWPLLLTAADHALLQADSIAGFCAQAQQTARIERLDLVVGLVDRAVVKARFPHSKRTVLRFSDAEFCGSNLFLLATPASLQALEVWSELEALRKQPWKIAWGLGLGVCVRYLLGRLSSRDAFAALSRRTGVKVGFCVLTEPELAVDVDSVADLELASTVLSDRAAP